MYSYNIHVRHLYVLFLLLIIKQIFVFHNMCLSVEWNSEFLSLEKQHL